MATLIEEDSPALMIIVLVCVFLIFVGCGLGLAYMGGVFTGKNEVIANDKRIMQHASLSDPSH